MNPKQIAILQAVSRETERSGWRYCKCSRVLALAAESLGDLDADSRRRLFTEGAANSRGIEELYAILIDLAENTAFLKGQGNLGCDDCGAADPMFTECCLTRQGKALVAKLEQNRKKAELDVAPNSSLPSSLNSTSSVRGSEDR